MSATTIHEHDSLTVLISLMYYTGTILLGRCLRSLVLSMVPPGHRVVPYLLNFVTAFQTCACSLENGTLRKRYGMPAYLVVLFSVGYWHSLSLPTGCAGNPCKNWRRFVRSEIGFAGATGLMACQLLGGQAAFWFARSYWSIGLTATHGQRLAASASCVSDLTVSAPFGFFLEFLSVFADSMLLVALAVFSGNRSWLRHQEVQRPMLYVLSTWLTYQGLFLTGMFANPANASAQTLGCRGTPLWLHFIVYWVAPLLAVSLGHRLEARFPFLPPRPPAPDEQHEMQE